MVHEQVVIECTGRPGWPAYEIVEEPPYEIVEEPPYEIVEEPPYEIVEEPPWPRLLISHS